MMGWYGDGPGWGGWLMMTLVMLPFWVLVILGSVALYRSLVHRDHRPQDRDGGARQILDQRYARGDIDADEYAARREALAPRH